MSQINVTEGRWTHLPQREPSITLREKNDHREGGRCRHTTRDSLSLDDEDFRCLKHATCSAAAWMLTRVPDCRKGSATFGFDIGAKFKKTYRSKFTEEARVIPKPHFLIELNQWRSVIPRNCVCAPAVPVPQFPAGTTIMARNQYQSVRMVPGEHVDLPQ